MTKQAKYLINGKPVVRMLPKSADRKFFYKRVRKGMDPEQAYELTVKTACDGKRYVIRTHTTKKKGKYCFYNVLVIDILNRDLGLYGRFLYNMRNRGMSPESSLIEVICWNKVKQQRIKDAEQNKFEQSTCEELTNLFQGDVDNSDFVAPIEVKPVKTISYFDRMLKLFHIK